MNLQIEIVIAQPFQVTASVAGSHVELVGQLDRPRWDDLWQTANFAINIAAAVLEVPPGRFEHPFYMAGEQPHLTASIRLIARAVDAGRARQVGPWLEYAFSGVVANASSAPLFPAPIDERPDVARAVKHERTALLQLVGGKVVRTGLVIRSDLFDAPFLISGRWATLPKDDGKIVETEEVLTGYADGFHRQQHLFVLLDRSGRLTYPVLFEEQAYLEPVVRACGRNGLGRYPLCRCTVLRRVQRERSTYFLRGLELVRVEEAGEEVTELELA